MQALKSDFIRIFGFVSVMTVLLSGCGDHAAPAEEVLDIPEQLAVMQGAWESVTTNGCTPSCGAVIEGNTVRLRYQEAPGSAMVRHSASIEQVDEEGQLLILTGGMGAWPYFHGLEEGEEHLEIEFFIQQHKEWRRMHLRRVGNPQA